MKAGEPRGGNNSRRHRCQRPKTPRYNLSPFHLQPLRNKGGYEHVLSLFHVVHTM